MRAQFSKIVSIFTINNIISVLFVAWIGNAIKGLYDMSQVPVVGDQAPAAGIVRSHIRSGQEFDLHFYLSREPTNDVTKSLYLGNITNAVYAEGYSEELALGSLGSRGKLTLENLTLPGQFCANETLYLQSVALSGGRPIASRVYRLSQYLIPIDDRDSKHFLLQGEATDAVQVEPFASIPSVIEVGVILETRALDMQQMMMKGMGRYIHRPSQSIQLPLHVNPFVTPRDEYVSLSQCPSITLSIVYKPVGMSYWLLSESLIRSFDQLEQHMSVNEYDIDSFKMLITGSSIAKLAIVYLVSILHFIFEYLSIRSDLSFWKSKTRFDGISESSISMNVVMGGISALYVIEQGESKIALYFILIKMAMNVWKIFKLRKTENAAEAGSLMDEIHKEEAVCMRWLMIGLLPIVVAFCAYRLVFFKFRSWYSWAILSVTAASEVFGFVTMTPQIFMNYRLKSVEHLPWTALTYSFINTFIDDLFAFGIFRVPEVSRYSCLRDDIVFVIVCVQRWYYKDRRVDEESIVEDKKEPEVVEPVVDQIRAGKLVNKENTKEPVRKRASARLNK